MAMRRPGVSAALGALGIFAGVVMAATGSTPAWADAPQHVISTVAIDFTVPAGEFCDFTYRAVGTLTTTTVILADRRIGQGELDLTHTNLDTGFTLTESDRNAFQFTVADGQLQTVGIHLSLRDADGNLVTVQAGESVISDTGEILKVTPSLNPDFAAVICPALGGQPAS